MREATRRDIEYLAENLRDEDVAELAASGVYSPMFALEIGFTFSSPHSFIIDDKHGNPGLILGVVPGEDEFTGYVWLVGTEQIQKESVRFLRSSSPILQQIHEIAPLLTNYVWAGNTVHIRWLRWLGFIFISQRTFPQTNETFYEFMRLSTCVDQQ